VVQGTRKPSAPLQASVLTADQAVRSFRARWHAPRVDRRRKPPPPAAPAAHRV